MTASVTNAERDQAVQSIKGWLSENPGRWLCLSQVALHRGKPQTANERRYGTADFHAAAWHLVGQGVLFPAPGAVVTDDESAGQYFGVTEKGAEWFATEVL